MYKIRESKNGYYLKYIKSWEKYFVEKLEQIIGSLDISKKRGLRVDKQIFEANLKF